MSGSNRSGNAKALDWVLPLFGITLAVALAWGFGWLQAREEYKREQASNSYAAAAKQDAQSACIGTDPGAVFECVNEKAKTAYQTAHDEQDLSAQQRAASSALASTVLSFLALALSGIGVWYIKRTLDATLEAVEDTGKATKAMERQNEIAESAQRPWITVKSLEIDPIAISKDADDRLFVAINGQVTVANIGQAIARNFCVISTAIAWKDSFRYSGLGESEMIPPRHPMGSIPDNLGPADERTVHFTAIEPIDEIMPSVGCFCVSVAVLYSTVGQEGAKEHIIWQTWDVAKKVRTRSTRGWDVDEIKWKGVLSAEVGLRHTHTLS